MEVDLMALQISNAQFRKISGMVYELTGINLQEGKEGLVKTRLTKRLRALELADFDQYLAYVEHDATHRELTTMLDVLTTNKTSFFRESQHFDFLREQLPRLLQEGGGRLRIWSAGCSSGEEPYTLSILLHEALPELARLDVRILATDISTQILAKARTAVYDEGALADVPPALLRKYFTVAAPGDSARWQAGQATRSLVKFAHLNLMESWPMKGPFDVIFCRNVMIYFDKPTQQRLVHRYWEYLRPGGYLFVGHSESLTASSREFRYVQPAVYIK